MQLEARRAKKGTQVLGERRSEPPPHPLVQSLGKRCKLPQRGTEQSPDENDFLCTNGRGNGHWCVATILALPA